jgi:aldehyde:ferredoxin oxidoreductase
VDTTLKAATEFEVSRFHVDLTDQTVRHEVVRCEDLEDALGGIARATKLLANVQVDDPYDPVAPLVMNLGLLSGTRVMTGLRTFFHGYSPLKQSVDGQPGLMWSAGSGHFGTKLRGLGIDEVIFTGRADRPTLLHLSPGDEGSPARFQFLDADDLTGRTVNDRIQDLHGRYSEAHFAVIGPAGENYESVRFASIALSTDNQLESGEGKPRFCGRGGYGGVMASKNLWAIAADGPNPPRARGLKEINREINLGEGSARYRDLEHDRGGTWRTMKMMQEAQSLPEFNFAPTGTDVSVPLLRPSVEDGPYVVHAEGCYLCGIKCHKNVFDQLDDGAAGTFRAKVDFEPITLLSSNLGIFDPDVAFSLIELTDELGMDSISLGVTLGFAMDHNRRTGSDLLGGLGFSDPDGVTEAIQAVAAGRLPELGQGVKRLSEQTGEIAYAMHSKGLEYPAYQPHTNPGFPWALAGGHMSMRTFFLYVIERETGVDYWVDAITNRGPLYLMDDITGLCKFANVDPDFEAKALRIAAGLDITGEELAATVMRTFLRGYACERRVGFGNDDYRLPTEAHLPMEGSDLSHFNTPEFFEQVQARVMDTLDKRAVEAGFM